MPNPFVTPINENLGAQSSNEMTIATAMGAFQEMLTLGNNPKEIEQILFAKYPKFKETAETIKKSGMNPINYAMQAAMQKKINVSPAIQNMVNMVNSRKNN